jgi:hypothetical protein
MNLPCKKDSSHLLLYHLPLSVSGAYSSAP